MKNERILLWAAIIAAFAAVAALWYAKAQLDQQRKQTARLVPRAIEGITHGMPTVAQTAWLPIGEELHTIQRALTDLDGILASSPNEIGAHNARGMCLARLGQYDDALAAYGHAVNLCRGKQCKAIVLNNIGDVYAEQCRLKDAEEKYRASLHMANSVLAKANLAACLLDQNRVDEALHEIVDIVGADSSFVGVELVYGKILWRHGEHKQALEHFERAVQIDPKYQPETHLELSKARMEMGDKDGALDEAAEAVNVAPNYAEAHAWYASVLGKVGATVDANAERRKATALMTARKTARC